MDEQATSRVKSRFGAQTGTHTPDKSMNGKSGTVPQNRESSPFTKLVDEHSLKTTPKAIREKPQQDRGLQILESPSQTMICRHCISPMSKTSRAILSIPSGILLILVGGALMGFYGLATNFYQVPWFIRFALPAAYYIGSIFVGIGVLFFFIRERIWKCTHCGEILKR
jgi:hypothetical protein